MRPSRLRKKLSAGSELGLCSCFEPELLSDGPALKRRGETFRPPSGSRGREIPQPNQVVGRRCEGEHPTNSLPPAMLCLAQAGDCLDPAEDLLDAFALALADNVTLVPRGARINRARSILVFILGHVRRHADP